MAKIMKAKTNYFTGRNWAETMGSLVNMSAEWSTLVSEVIGLSLIGGVLAALAYMVEFQGGLVEVLARALVEMVQAGAAYSQAMASLAVALIILAVIFLGSMLALRRGMFPGPAEVAIEDLDERLNELQAGIDKLQAEMERKL